MKRLQIILVIIGSVALLVGVSVIVNTAVAVPAAPQSSPLYPRPHENGIYVGGIVCYTCHAPETTAWDDAAFQPVTIETPVSIPVRARSSAEAHPVEVEGKTSAYTVYTEEDAAYTMGRNQYQRYVIRTTEGTLILRAHWNGASALWEEASTGQALRTCSDCHTSDFDYPAPDEKPDFE